MPTKPAQIGTRFGPDDAVVPARRRILRSERLALTVLAVLAVVALAAWQVPPMLDWSHTKSAIARYGSARLGRSISIGGQVRLTLLPHATLLADDVTLADRGDGISAKLGTLRLEVSIGALLAGRVVPQSLAIESPVVRLPWPLPRGAAQGAGPTISREFAASMDGGILTIAGVTARDVSARFHTDPDTGMFAAQGTASVAGLPWHFTALIGAPGRDGVSALTLTIDGQASRASHALGTPPRGAPGTGGAFHGRILGDGRIAGNLVLRGPNLSQLGDGPPVAWQAAGDIMGDGTDLTAPALDLTLGASPGHADMHVRLAPPASVQLHAVLGTLPAGAWLWRLMQDGPVLAPAMSADLDISAAAMPVSGGLVRSPHVRLSSSQGRVRVTSASADLPGGARLEASGDMAGQDSRRHLFLGHAHLTAPDLRHTLRWLTGARLDDFAGGLPGRCDIQGDLAVDTSRIALLELSGKLDDSMVSGDVAVTDGLRPSMDADLAFDEIYAGTWRGQGVFGGLATLAFPHSLAVLAGPFASLDTHFKLQAERVAFEGLALRQAVFDGQGGREGLTVHRLAADVPGGHFEAAGSIGTDGRLARGRLDLTAPEAAALPAAWRRPVRLWQGPFHLALTGAGPPQAIDAQMRADLGDLRGEAEGQVNTATGLLTATATLRHPGAPRLLEALGLPGAESWLGYGSLAVSAHLSAGSGRVQVPDFSVSAASLQLGGHADADLTGPVASVAGEVDAATLVLPGGMSAHATQSLPWAFLTAVQGNIGLKAARVLVGLAPVATDFAATLSMQDGQVLTQDLRASVARGQMTGQIAVDGVRDPPAVSMQGQGIGMSLGAAGDAIVGPGDGRADWSLSVWSQGYGAAALLANTTGRIDGKFTGIGLQGFDLAKVGALLAARGPALRGALQAAMSGGSTSPLDGTGGAVVADGRVTIEPIRLVGRAGIVDVTGNFDLDQSTLDLLFSAEAAVPAPPAIAIHVSGPWATPQRSANLKQALAWAGQLRKDALPPRRRPQKR